MTQLQSARQGAITAHMRGVSATEGIDAEELRGAIADGLVVVPANGGRPDVRPVGIGSGLRTKVNANIGTSPDAGSSATPWTPAPTPSWT